MNDNPNDHDELSGIFDHLTPEDFERQTTAIDETPRGGKGQGAFDAFVDEQLRALRVAFAAADGVVNPVAVLGSPTLQRVFAPDDDETMQDYVDRLNREARLMCATWVFISKQTLVGTEMTDPEDLKDTNDQGRVDRALAEGRLREGVYWYAERRESNERHHRHGIIDIEGDHLGQLKEGPSHQSIPLMQGILD